MKNSIPKNRILLRGAALALALCLLFSCASCGKKNTATALRADLSGRVYTLDPQYCSTALERCLLKNCMEGLLRRLPDGTMAEGCAENYSVSADGLRYTFTLRENLQWSDGEPLTAKDFVFAFRRLFRAETNSPYAVEFAALENSAAVLAGQMPESALGVTASGPLTLVFHLSSADDNFLEKLTLPGAMPCDEEFFNSTRGTYGLNASSTLSSGSFYLYNWTASGLFLRRSAASPLVNNLRLVQNTSNTDKSAAQLIADEKCSAALDDTAEATSLQSVEYSDTTWALLFNASEGSVFAVASLRQALAGIALQNLSVPASGLFTEVTGLVPDGLTVDGIVGKATWYKIKLVYNAVKSLSEITSEGLTISEAQRVYPEALRLGDTGLNVETVRFYLAFLGYFLPQLPPIPITDTFDQAMLDAVYAFQSAYGLKVDGVVGRRTWNALQNVYEQTLYTLPEDYQRFAREVYPGRFLVPGDTGEAVTLLQTRLNQIAAKNDAVPSVTVDGVYGQETARAVRAVQRLLGYIPTGAVGPVLWAYIITQGQGYGEV